MGSCLDGSWTSYQFGRIEGGGDNNSSSEGPRPVELTITNIPIVLYLSCTLVQD